MTDAAGPQREDGRHLFGRDAAGYARYRPPYPDTLWEQLDAYRPAAGHHVEIGPGTGLATTRLLAAGSTLTAIEPDPGLASPLRQRFVEAIAQGRLTVLEQTLEAARLPTGSFDAAHAATCFHWLTPDSALTRVRRWLRPGGAWAMWWNVFGDPRTPDDLARATADLFAPLAPNPSRRDGLPFALDAQRRRDELQHAGFEHIHYHELHWTLTQTTDQLVGLTATFSPVACLPAAERTAFLDRLARRVKRHFGGTVQRTVLTPLYLARAPEH